ncbi:heme-binding protein [Mycobacteroides abscessus subsp. bolletii]|uniref:hemophore-related protein n=1 Tax=Mycobacteroides abscessus TaxID=36809 RepID=UPI0019D2A1E8|nr:hemophore-related protein [Mycobacteroides abscessus]MBN7303935.1 heme-binding protein [Mycobacteroides abscessus subsp. bolletii]
MRIKIHTIMVLGVIVGGLGVAAPVQAKPGDCTVSEEARLDAVAATKRAEYLERHPDVNTGMSNVLKNTPGDGGAKHEAVQAYLDANPAARADLDAIRQPVQDFTNRCWPDG